MLIRVNLCLKRIIRCIFAQKYELNFKQIAYESYYSE